MKNHAQLSFAYLSVIDVPNGSNLHTRLATVEFSGESSGKIQDETVFVHLRCHHRGGLGCHSREHRDGVGVRIDVGVSNHHPLEVDTVIHIPTKNFQCHCGENNQRISDCNMTFLDAASFTYIVACNARHTIRWQ